ncbi:MAG TPA: GNAT family N-acetyltransferase [Bacteriovoracaceae bacterium]|nr:GNAT family N-acetyltransferase [Bacteriovoracaceae bacterium]
MNHEIRDVNKSDASELLFIADIDSKIPLDYDPHYLWDESRVKTRLEYYGRLAPESFFEVVELDRKVIAFHILDKTPDESCGKVGNIVTLWVDPAYRERGFAQILKTRAEAWATAKGFVAIQTTVHKSNTKMMSFNQKLGYLETYVSMKKLI